MNLKNDDHVIEHKHSDEGSNHDRGYHNYQERVILSPHCSPEFIQGFLEGYKLRANDMWFSSTVQQLDVSNPNSCCFLVEIRHGYDSGD